ncbi:MAG: 50S ribosomal protein L10 [Patescibacteria group bacterium]
MSKSRASKEQSMALVTQMVKQAKGAVLADFTGLKVKEMQELRRNLRARGIEYEVIKKSLLKMSLPAAGASGLDDAILAGFSVSVATSGTDETDPAKVLSDFAKIHSKLKILGGWLDKQFIDATKVKNLASLPGKTELWGQFVGVLAAPLTGLVSVMQGNLRGLVQVISAMQNAKSKM